jgi:dipeptide transport system substrate-binding protein
MMNRHSAPFRRRAACIATFAAVALLAAGAQAKTSCSVRGSPKTSTGCEHDRHVVRRQQPDLHRIVDFDRGTTSRVRPPGEVGYLAGRPYLTFTLRKGVKWHNHRAWKPSRDMNADDIIFMLERQGKEDNPYFKVTSSNHSYYNDMGMAKLIKSIQKVDDYTVRITLNKPEAPFLSNLAMEYAGVQSKEYADAMLKAGTPEKIDQEPIGTDPSIWCSTKRTQ